MHSSRKAFTLIELLVVIAIIAILAAILFPVFAQAKNAAKKTQDLSNIKQATLSTMMYANDSDDVMPLGDYLLPPPSGKPYWVVTWRLNVQPYTKNKEFFSPPNFKMQEASGDVFFDYSTYYEDYVQKVPLGISGMAAWANSHAEWAPNGMNFTEVPRPATLIALSTSRYQFSDIGAWTATKNWLGAKEQYPGKGTFVAYNRTSNFGFYDGHAKSMHPCRTFGALDWPSETPGEDFLWDWKERPYDKLANYRRFKQGDTPGYQANDYGCEDINEYNK